MSAAKKPVLEKIYQRLMSSYSERKWWPADSAFEIMVGAILTQNTAWTNVEKAIANLKQKQWLSADKLAAVELDALAEVIRPSGYYNIKARRLQAYCRWYVEEGMRLFASSQSLAQKRAALLQVHGIGPETADDILLYALELPVFVIDAYTRRIFSRLGLVDENASYEAIRQQFEKELPTDVKAWGEYHALIVEHGKDVCKTKPKCETCVLRDSCVYGSDEIG